MWAGTHSGPRPGCAPCAPALAATGLPAGAPLSFLPRLVLWAPTSAPAPCPSVATATELLLACRLCPPVTIVQRLHFTTHPEPKSSLFPLLLGLHCTGTRADGPHVTHASRALPTVLQSREPARTCDFPCILETTTALLNLPLYECSPHAFGFHSGLITASPPPLAPVHACMAQPRHMHGRAALRPNQLPCPVSLSLRSARCLLGPSQHATVAWPGSPESNPPIL